MASAELRFYGPLNDFLPPERRGAVVRVALREKPAVKDLVEALGVPHPEVELIIAGGEPVDFGHRVRDGDRIAVFPRFATLDLGSTLRVAPPERRAAEERFVVDGHLGRLAAYLRMLGFDTAYRNHATDDELARRSAEDDRTLLTRDRGLLKRSIVARGYLVRADRPHEQLAEVVERFGLATAARPFGRCLRCNGPLEAFEAAAARELVPPRVRWEQREFRRCGSCGTIYWKGSHHARMLRLIEAVAPGVVE